MGVNKYIFKFESDEVWSQDLGKPLLLHNAKEPVAQKHKILSCGLTMFIKLLYH